MMIEESIHIHDRYQCEIKLEYQLEDQPHATTYDLETYVFFANSLGINRSTYHKDDFYSDIQAYIRLKTPTVLLQDMLRGKNNPFDKLRTSIACLLAAVKPTTIAQYEYHIKMFCCIFKSAIRDHVAFIVTRQVNGDLEDLLVKYLESVPDIVQAFRTLRTEINVPIIEQPIFAIYAFGDEYLSGLLESYTYKLLEDLKPRNFFGKDQYIQRLLALVTAEIAYRQQQRYPSIPNAKATNEEFIFRTSALKKYIGNVLFLDTRIKRDGEFLEHLVFALAAGIAMVFATGAAFLAQIEYTNVSFPLFLVMVISYMFKDRIKEVFRGYLGSKLRHWLFDHKLNIYASPKEKIGWCKESFTFINDRNIPPQILKIRTRDPITEIRDDWAAEKTILYRKRIKLFRNELTRAYHDYPVESINDIMRLNVFRFLSKMDDPEKPVYITDGQSYQKIYGRRVYHVNMIMKYSMKNMIAYKRFRIVLSRDGIQRIEEVLCDQEYR